MIGSCASRHCSPPWRPAFNYCHTSNPTSYWALLTKLQRFPAAAQFSTSASLSRLGAQGLARLKCSSPCLRRLQQGDQITCMAKSTGGRGKEKALDNKKLVELLPDGRSAAVNFQ